MVGVTCARTGDPVASRKVRDGRVHVDDHARERVAERNRRIELREYGANRLDKPVALDLAHDLTHEIWPRDSLADQARLGEAYELALGAGADQRDSGPHEHRARAQLGDGNVGNLELAGPVVLKDLFQRALPSFRTARRRRERPNRFVRTPTRILDDFAERDRKPPTGQRPKKAPRAHNDAWTCEPWLSATDLCRSSK